jgi:tetratricopeptide (TPR) repeat protein
VDPLLDDLRALATGKQQFFDRGARALREGNLAKAAEEYEKMVAADPNDPLAQMELGAILIKQGNFQAAKKRLTEALRLSPNNSTALYNLGILHTQEGSRQEAIRYYLAALSSDPGLKNAHFQLANELVRAGQFDLAAPHYQTVMKLDPPNGFARLMFAVVLARLRRYGEALAALEESHLTLPEDMDISTALARLLSTSPERKMRNAQRALQLMEQVFKGKRQTVDVEQVEVLAMALAEIGSFDKAISIQQRMISEAERAGRRELAAALGETLAFYRQKKTSSQPWRDDDPIFNPVPDSLGPLTSSRDPAGMRQDSRK